MIAVVIRVLPLLAAQKIGCAQGVVGGADRSFGTRFGGWLVAEDRGGRPLPCLRETERRPPSCAIPFYT